MNTPGSMSKSSKEELRDAAVAVVSAAAEATTEFVRTDSSDSCGVEDDQKQLLVKGKWTPIKQWS